MLGRDEDDIMSNAGHAEPGQVERLGVDQPIYHQIPQQPESRGAYIGGRKDRLREILSGAQGIVFVGHHIGTRGRSGHGQCCSIAGRAADRIGDDDGKARPIVTNDRRRRRVSRIGRTRDRATILLPLVLQRSGANRRHAESGALPRARGLIRWLRSDLRRCGNLRLRHTGGRPTPARSQQRGQ